MVELENRGVSDSWYGRIGYQTTGRIMGNESKAAQARMARYGYVPVKERTDNCAGCALSTLRPRGGKPFLHCRRVGITVNAGSKCSEYQPAPGKSRAGLKLISKQGAENDVEDQGVSSVAEGCNKWPCKASPLVKTAIGWKCTKCGGDY